MSQKTMTVSGTVTEKTLAGAPQQRSGYGAAGRGVAYAVVKLTMGQKVTTSSTDKDGKFAVTVPAGVYLLQVLSPAHAPHFETVSHDATLTIELPRSSV